jgi:hypothetical protein
MTNQKRAKSANFTFIILTDLELKEKMALRCIKHAKSMLKQSLEEEKNIVNVEFNYSVANMGIVIIIKVSMYGRLYKFSTPNLGKKFKKIMRKKDETSRVILHDKNCFRKFKNSDILLTRFTSKEF